MLFAFFDDDVDDVDDADCTGTGSSSELSADISATFVFFSIVPDSVNGTFICCDRFT